MSTAIRTFRVLGLMSGSSLDGLDLALCTFTLEGGNLQEWQLLQADTLPFGDELRNLLAGAATLTGLELMEADARFGRWMGDSCRDFLAATGVQADLVASHGHTVFHHPDRGFSTQIGQGAALASACRLPAVTDLRSADIAAGGQGAPMVPIAERDLFPGYRFYLNIGGIVNISIHDESSIRAWDVCPGNQVLDRLAGRLGLPYDDSGKLAAAGKPDAALLKELRDLPYFSQQPPKSLDNGWVSDRFLPSLESRRMDIPDLLATMTAFMADQVADAVLGSGTPSGRMLATGGGAFNEFLIRSIGSRLPQTELVLPDDEIIRSKEAIMIAWAGLLRWLGRPNFIPSVTGARYAASGGAVWL